MMRESDFIHPWNDVIPDADIFSMTSSNDDISNVVTFNIGISIGFSRKSISSSMMTSTVV